MLGQIAYTDRHDLYLDIDGYGLFANGEGALTGDSGDALFVRYTFLPRLTPTGATEATGAFVVTGGKGKYGGAGCSLIRLTFPAQAARGEASSEKGGSYGFWCLHTG